MKVLDDIYCGIQHDIPTAKECYRAINKDSKGGWRTRKGEFKYSKQFLDSTPEEEYDPETDELIRGCKGFDNE